MTSVITYFKSDKKFSLYSRDKKFMRKVKACLVHRIARNKPK